MNDRVEVLFRLYEEAMHHVRHLEEQRSHFASVLVGVSGGVVAFAFADGRLHPELYSGPLLTGIGAFGALLSWKQNEKINYHRRVAIRHRKLISEDPTVSSDQLEQMRSNEEQINDRQYRHISIAPIGLFWSLLYVMLCGLGLFIMSHA